MVITISNRYGCGALLVAQHVAETLGYEYVDEQLPVVVAKRLQTSPEAVESAEDIGQTMGERVLRSLELGTPEVRAEPGPTFDEECLREVQEAVREYAAHGNAVLIGRGAHAILGRRPGVLRVFMLAPREWRIRHVMDNANVDEKTATAELDRIDRARGEYVRAYYGIDWTDAANYDLAVDTSTFGVEGSAAIIIAAARAR
ncbi:MAG TPA: cytidylate kinase-like family protein [Candidatus Rubrimentiphilum sp.]|nr:cytidylate kinase-like family protein [Candidatus Rubrimentiphilum sp.]